MKPVSQYLRVRSSVAMKCALIPLFALLGACGGSPADDIDGRASAQGFSPALQPAPTPTPQPFRIISHPEDATVGKGAGVQFGVFAGFQRGLSYQWFKDGVALPGQTSAQLVIAAATAADQGRYRARVRDSLGQSALSNEAKLSVVSGTWARLSGRAIYPAPFLKQPALALCGGQPVVAHLMSSNGRVTLYAHFFDGLRWQSFGTGAILNATAEGSAADPAIDCVDDGTASRPVVAWSEGDANARDIYVKTFDGASWVTVGVGALNATRGSFAVKPTLRATPLDPNTGNIVHQGLTLRSAIAWIENGVASLSQWTRSGWQALPGGIRISGSTDARDIALTIELDEIGRTYPPVVAWLEQRNGVQRVHAATHNLGLGGWIEMAAPISDAQGALPAAAPRGRIGIGVGKFQNGRQPLAVWARGTEADQLLSYMYPTEHFVNGNVNRPWDRYADPFAAGGTIQAAAFDPREFRRQCNNGTLSPSLLTFGLAITHNSGFEVRRGNCGTGAFTAPPAQWELVRTPHGEPLQEIALRMATEDDPLVAGTQVVSGQFALSVWKYYP